MEKEQFIAWGIMGVFLSLMVAIIWSVIISRNEFERKCLAADGIPFYGRTQIFCISSINVIEIK